MKTGDSEHNVWATASGALSAAIRDIQMPRVGPTIDPPTMNR